MSSTNQQDEEDFQDLTGAAKQDLLAFERLYKRFDKRVYHYLKVLVLDRALAEEILVDTMTAVWNGAGTFSRRSRVSTWIFGIARNKALDALRKNKRDQLHVPLDDIVELPSSQPTIPDEIQRNQTSVLMKQALTMLSREHQEILRLVFYEELPYEEIASLLSISVNTVKTRVYYAKQHLKKCLEQLGHKELI